MFAVGLAVPLLLAQACSERTSGRVLRLAHGLDVSHPVHRAFEHMAEVLADRSGGRMRLLLYPSEQLCSERECIELLQLGSLALTKVSASVLENFAPGFAIFTVPYLFRDRDHRFAVLDGSVGQHLLRSAGPLRLWGLGYLDAGSRSFYTREHPLRSPEDLRGLRIRTQESPSAIAVVESMGAAATPISWGELYTALQQGVVDGAENNPPSYHLSGHYQVAPFLTLDEHTAVPDVLLVGMPIWESLSERERGWLEEAVEAGVRRQRQLWQEATAEALRVVRASGVEVIEPDPDAFAAATQDYRERVGRDPMLGPLLLAIGETRP